MGYNTHFKLETSATSKVEGAIIASLPDHEEVRILLEDSYGTSWKWYSWVNHMKAFSEKWPDVTFTLSGDGEDDGDIWRAYFQGGKMQSAKAKVVYEKFDPEKLQ